MTDTELLTAFKNEGYKVIRIKHWGDGSIYVTITKGSHDRLAKASAFGRTLGVTVTQPL